MIYIFSQKKAQLSWKIFKSGSKVLERFDRAMLNVFLIGNRNTRPLQVELRNGVICAEIPEGLEEGVYSIEAIWYKNWMLPNRPPHHGHSNMPDMVEKFHPAGHPCDPHGEPRNISRSRRDFVFAVTDYECEATPFSGAYPQLNVETSVATYGYDGLNAYEIAVMLGNTTLTLQEWSAANSAMSAAEDERKREEQKRKEAELLRVQNYNNVAISEAERSKAEIVRATNEIARNKAELERKRAWDTMYQEYITLMESLTEIEDKLGNLDADEVVRLVGEITTLKEKVEKFGEDVQQEQTNVSNYIAQTTQAITSIQEENAALRQEIQTIKNTIAVDSAKVNKLVQILSVEDEDGNGLPDGEDRIRELESANMGIGEEEAKALVDRIFGNS